MNIFVTSDTHFNHNKDFIYQSRGFETIQQHDEAIVQRWNETVGVDDAVYLLGDTYMGGDEQYALKTFNRLHGHIHLIRGNHDTDNKMEALLRLPNIVDVAYATVVKVGKNSFYLSHYPAIVGDARCGMPKTISLHGHTHHNDAFEFVEFCCYNVNLDAHGLRPVNIETIRPLVCNELTKRHIIK